jgi:hypothetical protein
VPALRPLSGTLCLDREVEFSGDELPQEVVVPYSTQVSAASSVFHMTVADAEVIRVATMLEITGGVVWPARSAYVPSVSIGPTQVLTGSWVSWLENRYRRRN